MAVKDYKDPRWQKLRLEIMSRDKFTCKCCGDKESELQVHHLAYAKGKRIWEALPSDLLTMCHACHEETEQHVQTMRRYRPMLMSYLIKGPEGKSKEEVRNLIESLKTIKREADKL